MPSTHGPRLELHDIDNAEGFVSAIVARSGLELDHHDREDLCQFCLVLCWQLSLQYEPNIIRGGFSTWAGITIKKRINDWQRKRYGRTKWTFKDRVYERPRTELVSFDAELDNTLASGSGDPASDCSPDLERVLDSGRRTRARDYEALGLDAA
jgi:hypothetical protein